MITYKSDNNEYTVELSKIDSIFSDRVLCNLKFKDSIDNIVLDLTISEIDLLNMIDNIYEGLYLYDILYTFQTPNKDNITYSIGLTSYPNENNVNTVIDYLNVRRYITIYKNDLYKVLTFEITNSLDQFCELLYDEYIDSLPDDKKKEILNL